jgi:hypothetical protein
MNPAIDFLGREIKAGDTIIYPVRQGSAMWLKKLTLSHADCDGVCGYNNTGHLIHIKNLKNVIVVSPAAPNKTANTILAS